MLNTELIPSSATKNATGVQVFTLKKNSTVSGVYTKQEFQTEDPEYYRTRKVPTTGHFIQEKDKVMNDLPGQLTLEEALAQKSEKWISELFYLHNVEKWRVISRFYMFCNVLWRGEFIKGGQNGKMCYNKIQTCVHRIVNNLKKV